MSPAAVLPDVEEPPAVLQLLAHPLRWRLLRELTRSDRSVRELTEQVGEPQNLVSYHLRRLRDGELVRARRSAADGRDSYYAIDLDRCQQELHGAGASLHPALPLAGHDPAPARAGRGRRRRVLFLCTGNSARSQMAEALLEHAAPGAVSAASAGSRPKPLHPNAVRAMAERGIDIRGNHSKHLDELVAQPFDTVVTLCDRVREVCPELPSRPELVHWSLPDPAQEGTGNRATYPAFRRTAAELETRIRFLLPRLVPPTTTTTRSRRSSRAEH